MCLSSHYLALFLFCYHSDHAKFYYTEKLISKDIRESELGQYPSDFRTGNGVQGVIIMDRLKLMKPQVFVL